MAKYKNEDDDDIGIFEIPAGATIYVNYRFREVLIFRVIKRITNLGGYLYSCEYYRTD